jgi:peptidoglycan hydrolase-like protein with peptidoglycan-binding domain
LDAAAVQLQELLAQLGYEVNVDGVYDNKTAAEVVRFQKDNFLTADGIYGADTHAALMDAVADNDAPTAPEAPAEPPMEEAVKMVEVVSKGGNVNIRSGNGTEYSRVSSVKPGTKFEFVATAVNGWHAFKIGGKIGWVSGDYSKLV